ncbi:hypothetical protein GCM10019059_35640 [Camelimonas fluminis]|nr:hypothetical protein GCM10019059_35640 [Camelimonas fluminis]
MVSEIDFKGRSAPLFCFEWNDKRGVGNRRVRASLGVDIFRERVQKMETGA